jgi:hypothetical protein
MNYDRFPEAYRKTVRVGSKTLLFTEPVAIKDIFTLRFPKVDSLGCKSLYLLVELNQKLSSRNLI